MCKEARDAYSSGLQRTAVPLVVLRNGSKILLPLRGKGRKEILTNIDHKRTRQCHMRAHAVEAALKCLIAEYPAAIFYAFVCPTGSLQHFDALTRHDSA